MHTIKWRLMKAGRYEDVMSILNDIMKLNDWDYPVNPSVNQEGNWYCQVKGDSVRRGAQLLIEIIEGKQAVSAFDYGNADCMALDDYVNSELDVKLHNYGIDAIYGFRDIDKAKEMEAIKALYILWCLMNDLSDYFVDPELRKGYDGGVTDEARRLQDKLSLREGELQVAEECIRIIKKKNRVLTNVLRSILSIIPIKGVELLSNGDITDSETGEVLSC